MSMVGTTTAKNVAPSRARGSKQQSFARVLPAPRRAFTGAWIETTLQGCSISRQWVAPSRARGSKRGTVIRSCCNLVSRLHGRVDRNVRRLGGPCRGRCRAFTGAWIETPQGYWPAAIRCVAPSRARGSKLDNRQLEADELRASRLHGRVDRNIRKRVRIAQRRSRAFTGAWIETEGRVQGVGYRAVAPSRARGSKLQAIIERDLSHRSRLHGRVDRNSSSLR